MFIEYTFLCSLLRLGNRLISPSRVYYPTQAYYRNLIENMINILAIFLSLASGEVTYLKPEDLGDHPVFGVDLPKVIC